MNRGYSLLEVVVALAVVSIGVIGVLGAVLHSMRAQQAARERITAQNAAKSKIEEITGSDFASVVSTYSGTGFTVSGLAPVEGDADGLAGRVVIDATDPTLLDIEVIVEWSGAFAWNRTSFRTQLTSK